MSIPYLPFTKHDDRPHVGLSLLDLRDWIEVDVHWEKHIRLKAEILRDFASTVLHVLPGSEEACLELREVLAGHLAAHFPAQFQLQSGVLTNPLGVSFAPVTGAAEALAQISQWTQEDWAIMSPRAPVKMEAGIICFPSRWSPADKIGLPSAGIHAPVPKFSTIAKPTEAFLERLAPDKPMWRLNWTIHDSDRLFCPKPISGPGDLTEDDVLERTWLRVERQTLRRLPSTKAVVFSIRTYLHPMAEVVADPERRVRVSESLASLTEEAAAYKGMRAFHGLLKRRLAREAQS